LKLQVSPIGKSSHFFNRFIESKQDSPLEGIISQLTSECGGNVHDRHVVTVTGNVYRSPHGFIMNLAARNVADLKNTNCFQSQDAPDQSLCYNFLDRRVKPTQYSIHTHSGTRNLTSWVIEGSMDEQKWDELDRQENNQGETNSPSRIGTFFVKSSDNCQFIRIRQTAKHQNGHDVLMLYGFELFGQLIG
jgi:hypothetical protein